MVRYSELTVSLCCRDKLAIHVDFESAQDARQTSVDDELIQRVERVLQRAFPAMCP